MNLCLSIRPGATIAKTPFHRKDNLRREITAGFLYPVVPFNGLLVGHGGGNFARHSTRVSRLYDRNSNLGNCVAAMQPGQ